MNTRNLCEVCTIGLVLTPVFLLKTVCTIVKPRDNSLMLTIGLVVIAVVITALTMLPLDFGLWCTRLSDTLWAFYGEKDSRFRCVFRVLKILASIYRLLSGLLSSFNVTEKLCLPLALC